MTKARKTAELNQSDILLYDLETTTMKVHTWSLYPERISHDNIIDDWSIICAGYKWLGQKTQALQVSKVGDDKELCIQLREIMSKAKILVGHNSRRFDTKKFNARLIFHGLEPLPDIQQVDTLKEIKKIAAFSSNRLDYLGKVLTGKGKINTSYSLWLDVANGSKKALKDMVTYCKGDVDVLEALYLKLRPYMGQSHPHIGVINNLPKETCNKCGSDCIKDGIRITAGGNKQQIYRCTSCGGYHRITFKQVK